MELCSNMSGLDVVEWSAGYRCVGSEVQILLGVV